MGVFRFRESRCLLVACLRYTQGLSFFATEDKAREESCCPSCHKHDSNQPGLTSAVSDLSNDYLPYQLNAIQVMAGCNKKERIEDPPAEDEQEVTKKKDSTKNAHLKRFDWREKGAVTDVREQKNCGCCYAIASSGSMEGLGKITTGILEEFSVQQLIDCDVKGRNLGCYGGCPLGVFEYVMKFGLTTEKIYPFTSHKKFGKKTKYEDAHKRYRRCKKVDPNSLVYISGFQFVDANGDALEAALLINPVVVRILVDNKFDNYSGGVIGSWLCPAPRESQVTNPGDNLHDLLLVAFDETESGIRYWVAKNSWGPEWGEGGYCRIYRDEMNPYGILGITAFRGIYPTGFHRRPVPPSTKFSKPGLGPQTNPDKKSALRDRSFGNFSSSKLNEMSLFTVNKMHKVANTAAAYQSSNFKSESEDTLPESDGYQGGHLSKKSNSFGGAVEAIMSKYEQLRIKNLAEAEEMQQKLCATVGESQELHNLQMTEYMNCYKKARAVADESAQRIAAIHSEVECMLQRIYCGEEISQEERIRCLNKILVLCQRPVSSPYIAGH